MTLLVKVMMRDKKMAYDLNTLKESFENTKYNEAYFGIFFVEAEKYLRAEIPSSPQTTKLYNIAEDFFSPAYDFNDLIQDCLLKLWEQAVKLNLVHTEGPTVYLITLAEYVLHDFVSREIRRNKIVKKEPISEEAETTPYFDNFDDEEELTEAAEKLKTYEPGKKKPDEVIVQVDKNTYECLAEYKTISEAAKATGVDKKSISFVLSGKRKTAGGFIWVKHDHPLLGTIKKNV